MSRYKIKLRRNGAVIGTAEVSGTQADAHAAAQKIADEHPTDKVTMEPIKSPTNAPKSNRKRKPVKRKPAKRKSAAPSGYFRIVGGGAANPRKRARKNTGPHVQKPIPAKLGWAGYKIPVLGVVCYKSPDGKARVEKKPKGWCLFVGGKSYGCWKSATAAIKAYEKGLFVTGSGGLVSNPRRAHKLGPTESAYLQDHYGHLRSNPYEVATYKGRNYKLLWSGKTKYGERAHLAFFDGSKDFWVDAKLITVSSGRKRSGRSGRYECDECGDYVTPGSQCWETGMIH